MGKKRELGEDEKNLFDFFPVEYKGEKNPKTEESVKKNVRAKINKCSLGPSMSEI